MGGFNIIGDEEIIYKTNFECPILTLILSQEASGAPAGIHNPDGGTVSPQLPESSQ